MKRKIIGGLIAILALGTFITIYYSIFKNNPAAYALAINTSLSKAYINQDSDIYIQITDRQGKPAPNKKVALTTNSQKTRFPQKYYTSDSQGIIIAPIRLNSLGKTIVTAKLGELTTSTEIIGKDNKDDIQIFWSTAYGDKTLLPSTHGVPLTFTAFKNNKKIESSKNYLRISADSGYFLIDNGNGLEKSKKAKISLSKESTISYINGKPGKDTLNIKLLKDGVIKYQQKDTVQIIDKYNIRTIKKVGNTSGENISLMVQLTDQEGNPVADKHVEMNYIPTASVKPIILPKVITDENGQASINFTSAVIPGKNNINIAVKDDNGYSIAEKLYQFNTKKGIRSIIPKIDFVMKDKDGKYKTVYLPPKEDTGLIASIDNLLMGKAYAGIDFSLGTDPYVITSGWQSQAEVTIQVLDNATGLPITDALVTWNMPIQSKTWFTTTETTTDGSGYSTVIVNSSKVGSYDLTVDIGGFSPVSAIINVNPGVGYNIKWLEESIPENNMTATIQVVDWGKNATSDISKINFIEVDGGQASQQGMYEFSTDQTTWTPQLKILPNQLDADGKITIYGKRLKDTSTISEHFIYARASINTPPWSPNIDLYTEYQNVPIIP